MGMAEDVKNLGEDIVASYNARIEGRGTIVKETQTLTKNTQAMLKGFRVKRREMSAEQAEALTGFSADLTKKVGGLLKRFGAEHEDMASSLKASLGKNTREIETYVKNKLREFSDAHAEMSDELKNDLAKYVGDIVNGTRERLGAFHAEREQMAAHWKAMSALLAQKRTALPIEVKAGAEVKAVESAAAKSKRRKSGRTSGKKG